MTKPTELQLDAGVFVAAEFTARGGIHYHVVNPTVEAPNGEGTRAEWTTARTIDHAELHVASKQILARARYLLGRYCVSTPLGHFLPERNRVVFAEAMLPVSNAALAFNSTAHSTGYERRVRTDFYTFTISTDDSKVATRLAEIVRERLAAMSAALHARDREAFDAARGAARNLASLAVGIQREGIEAALECADIARKLLVTNPGAVLELEALDAAERLFY